MQVTTVGIDLAKNVFQVHGVDARGRTVLRRQLRRDQLVRFFANHPECLIGIEARGGAHHWARKLESLGHTVRLMAPQFVKPYVKSNKTDAADAEAICEAVSRPSMRFVPLKSPEQQATLALHRVRQGFVKARTAQANQIRGLLAEFGLVVPRGISFVLERIPGVLKDAGSDLPEGFRELTARLLDHFRLLDQQVKEIEDQIKAWHRSNQMSQRLEKIPGIGPLTASALAATIGNGRNFDNGRQLAAWRGLVPRQHSSGGKPQLLGMSKRGDAYLRTLLIHGARSVIFRARQKVRQESWLSKLVERRNANVAAVALANKPRGSFGHLWRATVSILRTTSQRSASQHELTSGRALIKSQVAQASLC